MILTDYLLCEKSIQWDYARQMGITHGAIRLPEDSGFDVTNYAHWKKIHDAFTKEGIKPIVVEPMPNNLHSHIKTGGKNRDASIEKVIQMLPIMDKLDIRTICVNFMAHIGWLRTKSDIKERGGALVTGFDINDFVPTDKIITHEELWKNWEYFIKAVIPYAEKHHIKIALHPDDPPVQKLGGVARILTSLENVQKAVHTIKSGCLGVTMCQATFYAMGEDLEKALPAFAAENKIFFVHFRNITGNTYRFNETFHDNGQIDMAKMIKLYKQYGVNVPIRVDHVPTMAGEDNTIPGYASAGRLFAVGYLKGLLAANNA